MTERTNCEAWLVLGLPSEIGEGRSIEAHVDKILYQDMLAELTKFSLECIIRS